VCVHRNRNIDYSFSSSDSIARFFHDDNAIRVSAKCWCLVFDLPPIPQTLPLNWGFSVKWFTRRHHCIRVEGTFIASTCLLCFLYVCVWLCISVRKFITWTHRSNVPTLTQRIRATSMKDTSTTPSLSTVHSPPHVLFHLPSLCSWVTSPLLHCVFVCAWLPRIFSYHL